MNCENLKKRTNPYKLRISYLYLHTLSHQFYTFLIFLLQLAQHILELLKDKGELTDKVIELEEQNSHLYNDLTCTSSELTEKTKMLEQAKEHIRTLISCLIDWVQEGDKGYCYIADAEQFLKENE